VNVHETYFTTVDIYKYWTPDAIQEAKEAVNAEELSINETEAYEYWEKIRYDENVSTEEKARAIADCQDTGAGGWKGGFMGLVDYHNRVYDKQNKGQVSTLDILSLFDKFWRSSYDQGGGDGPTVKNRISRRVLPCHVAGQRTEGCIQESKGPGEVSVISGIRGNALRGCNSCVLPAEQPLSLAAGNACWKPFPDHETCKRGLHDLFQHQAQACRSPVPGEIQGNTCRGR
jgi:hypothetical protein